MTWRSTFVNCDSPPKNNFMGKKWEFQLFFYFFRAVCTGRLIRTEREKLDASNDTKSVLYSNLTRERERESLPGNSMQQLKFYLIFFFFIHPLADDDHHHPHLGIFGVILFHGTVSQGRYSWLWFCVFLFVFFRHFCFVYSAGQISLDTQVGSLALL